MNSADERRGGSTTVGQSAARDSSATREGSAAHVEDFASTRASALKRARRRDAALLAIVIAGLASVFLLSRQLDSRRPAEDAFASYEEFYVRPETARRLSLGFNGLVADWYWLRSLQYVGRKVDAYKGDITLDDMTPLGIRTLGPLLDHATTLDPQFMAAYEFGAVVLPSIDRDAAINLVEKGIRANPGSWQLHHQLGYIYWQAGRYADASEAYAEGARLPGAPAWMGAMAAQMNVQGGSRQVAREMYRRIYDESADEQVRSLALKRLAQIDSLDERDLIRRALADFRTRSGRCPSSWREVAPALRAARLKLNADGSPLDPAGFPYMLDASTCDVMLDESSPIPKR
jgi:tetratricopeptide (TPR) repeat protein